MSDGAGRGGEAPDLGALIDMQIRQSGPMSVASYMALCLTHGRAGYYQQANPIGMAGDFITSPEISQMFGELIGFFVVSLWQQMGEPPDFTLFELGPGRGTLMEDALRVACRAPGFREALDLELFEAGGELRAEQARRLAAYDPHWAEDIELGGDDPLIVIANEFFDALPIRQFVAAADGWHERMVGLKDGRRVFGLSPTAIPASALPEPVRHAEPGAVFEAGLAASALFARLAQSIARRGGAALVIDYGYSGSQVGETLQAVRAHAYAELLEAPGENDISAHVDFGALAEVAQKAGLTAHPLTPQEEFLRGLGIAERAEALRRANPSEAETIDAAVHRLTHPDQMGQLFKVFCATSPGMVPPGLAQ